jgi:hypothetical protein
MYYVKHTRCGNDSSEPLTLILYNQNYYSYVLLIYPWIGAAFWTKHTITDVEMLIRVFLLVSNSDTCSHCYLLTLGIAYKYYFDLISTFLILRNYTVRNFYWIHDTYHPRGYDMQTWKQCNSYFSQNSTEDKLFCLCDVGTSHNSNLGKF